MGFHTLRSPYDWGRVDVYRRQAKAVADHIIDLSVGSPVDPVPSRVRQALATAADEANAHGYPAAAGTASLRTSITDWLLNCRGVDLIDIGGDLVPTVGSKEAVALMASMLHLAADDVVVQPQVSYPTYEIGTQLAGAQVLKVADVADVASWRHIPGVRAVWVNSPCNPTGEVLSRAQLADIVASAREMGAVVLSDECYALMGWSEGLKRRSDDQNGDDQYVASDSVAVPDAAPCVLDATVCGQGADGVLMLYSLSKQSNMAGYRAAFMAGDRELVSEMKEYRKQIGQIIPGPVQGAMVEALRHTDAVCAQRERYRSRLVRMVAALRSYGYDAVMPEGGLYVWVRARSGNCWRDMGELAARGIVASPGEFYGDRGSLRFSATACDDDIEEFARRAVMHDA